MRSTQRTKIGQSLTCPGKWTLSKDPAQRYLQLRKRAIAWEQVQSGYTVFDAEGNEHNVPVAIVFEQDKHEAQVHGVRVSASVYDALSSAAYADAFNALTEETMHLEQDVPKSDGRLLIKRILESDKSLTTQMELLMNELANLQLSSVAEYDTFFGKWCELRRKFNQLPDGKGKQFFNATMQRSQFLLKIKKLFPSVRERAFTNELSYADIVKEVRTLVDLRRSDAKLERATATALLATQNGGASGQEEEYDDDNVDSYYGYYNTRGDAYKNRGYDGKRKRGEQTPRPVKRPFHKGKGKGKGKGQGKGQGKGGRYNPTKHVRSYVVHLDSEGCECVDWEHEHDFLHDNEHAPAQDTYLAVPQPNPRDEGAGTREEESSVHKMDE